ncbi:MAG: hypothetical protein AMQ22_00020 [Candidatus Methanofastidiosum methylothiophilum]|uniref:Uncharacterized protein n=1 Tax=Candidatus Methanofastidiosum methylothiophilum TaxID=1705564 RepID=A0A150J9D9_9EURY|nr:MAG: hypothetical protein AMQ22_00020 [Candidatus Methanofastidiosum methylthiophilus]
METSNIFNKEIKVWTDQKDKCICCEFKDKEQILNFIGKLMDISLFKGINIKFSREILFLGDLHPSDFLDIYDMICREYKK